MVERSSLLRFTPVAHDRPLPHRLVRLLPCPASRSSPRHRASIISSTFPSPYNAQGSVHSFCFSHDMGTGLARAWRVDRRPCEVRVFQVGCRQILATEWALRNTLQPRVRARRPVVAVRIRDRWQPHAPSSHLYLCVPGGPVRTRSPPAGALSWWSLGWQPANRIFSSTDVRSRAGRTG